ncbi:hypothetical protein CU097_008110, partial [Rhizopus azygosporus]
FKLDPSNIVHNEVLKPRIYLISLGINNYCQLWKSIKVTNNNIYQYAASEALNYQENRSRPLDYNNPI